ncbi:MAG TPA: hypothetical protein VJ867_06015 [Gemmatimonadaceae bacterium]|nr:hypothetical protein [Gemmatimonadaceae bacterium]
MRLLALGIFISAACACVSAGARARGDEQRPIIVFVHGRGQFGQDTAILRREWEADMDSSLALQGVPPLRDSDVRLAWYADALDPDSAYECGSRLATADAGLTQLRDVASGFLNFLAGAIGEDSRELRGLVGETMYVLDARTRCAAENRVGQVLTAAARENRPVIVVAFSLGSLVTYGYLLRDDSLHNLRLITIGSPLALRPVREIIFGETGDGLRVPSGVVSWTNVYDAADVLSGPLSGQLPGNVAQDVATHAPASEEAHVIARYLRDPATGSALMSAICAVDTQATYCRSH